MSDGEDEHGQETDAEADRAERLSRRRKDRSQSRDGSPDNTVKTDEVDDTNKMSGIDDTDNVDNKDATDELSEPIKLSQSTKEQMMHLPADQHKRLHHLYTRMKADYEYEYDEAFEMNRHYFPLVLQYGLEQFEEREADDIRQDLAEFGDGSQ